MATPQIQYASKSFSDIQADLINIIQTQYPDQLNDFNDASIGRVFIDLIAALGENLNYSINNAANETQLENAQQRRSLFEIARTFGYNIRNVVGSVTVCQFTAVVPALGPSYDPSYLPIIKLGSEVVGGGQVFTLLNDVDFSSAVSASGTPNRSFIPNLDTLGNVVNYTVTKDEVVYNGSIKIFPKVVRGTDFKPFLSVVINDTNVIDIEQVIVLPGINNPTPTTDQFFNTQYAFYEVDYLLQQQVLVDNPSITASTANIQVCQWLPVTQKFIKEFTPNGFCKVIFGGGNGQVNLFQQSINNSSESSFLNNYLQNTALGEIPPVNSQIFIRYRSGGGAASNVGIGVLTNFGQVTIVNNGAVASTVQKVQRSLTVTNIIPALGGADAPGIEEIRRSIQYNYSAQERCITLADYKSQVGQMNPRYGIPFRYNVLLKDNKIQIPILGLNADGTLNNTSTSVLQENIAMYLSQYRSLNDYVEITDGKIINIAITITVYINNVVPPNQIALNIINDVQAYFNINTSDMNEDIYFADLTKEINDVNGVINVLNIQVFNKVGNGYSQNQITQPLVAGTANNEIELVHNALIGQPDSMFEIKYPQFDISVIPMVNSQL